MKRFSYWFLFGIFILAIVIGAIRPLRVSPLYQVIGVIQFAAMALAAWTLGARAITATAHGLRLLALAGIFLVTPFALLALLWVGLRPAVGSNPGREPNAISGAQRHEHRDRCWIRGAQRSAQCCG